MPCFTRCRKPPDADEPIEAKPLLKAAEEEEEEDDDEEEESSVDDSSSDGDDDDDSSEDVAARQQQQLLDALDALDAPAREQLRVALLHLQARALARACTCLCIACGGACSPRSLRNRRTSCPDHPWGRRMRTRPARPHRSWSCPSKSWTSS